VDDAGPITHKMHVKNALTKELAKAELMLDQKKRREKGQN